MFSLSSHHTFALPSSCAELISVSDISTLKAAFEHVSATPQLILGEGSNCVFIEDFEGSVIKVAIMGKACVSHPDYYEVTAGAGENWHDFVVWCMNHGYYGLENLALIPGTVGAAPVQNIGAYGIEIDRFIEKVTFLDRLTMHTQHLNKEACQFAYRDSIFKHELANRAVITQVTFRIPKRWQPVKRYAGLNDLPNPSAHDIFNKVIEIRQSKLPDPARIGNAGSFFKNPVVSTDIYEKLKERYPLVPGFSVNECQYKVPAAWLIEQAGFKGKAIGGIRCHPTQPLVLTNLGTGTGEELLNLARMIRGTVKSNFGITLENEVRLIGKQGLIEL